MKEGRAEAEAQYSSIVKAVAALNCDYDRLQELRDAHSDMAYEVVTWHPETDEHKAAQKELAQWDAKNAEELAALEEEANGCKDRDEAEERIRDEALSIEVRSGWASPGDVLNCWEYRVDICMGGPAVRICGDLGGVNQPTTARLEYQDFSTPWTEYSEADQDVLLEYVGVLYFGG